MDRDEWALLTPREHQIVLLIGDGHDSREIATQLDIAYFTVRKHRANIQAKLRYSSAARLSAHSAVLRAPAVPQDRASPWPGPP